MAINIPLYSILFLYFAFLIVFAVFSMVNIYHIVASGTLTLASFSITFLTSALTVITLYLTWTLLAEVEWKQALTIFDSSWFSNVLPT